MQPLDVNIFEPFNAYYDNYIRTWLRAHPRESFTIYHITVAVNHTICQAMTPGNIISRFKKIGIFLLNKNVFADHEFLPSEVTNRLETQQNTETVSSIYTIIPFLIRFNF